MGKRSVCEFGVACSYGGPTTLEPGPVTVGLRLTSLGHNEVILASLEEGRSYPELVAYLDEAADPVNDWPTWITEIVTLELEHGSGERGHQRGFQRLRGHLRPDLCRSLGIRGTNGQGDVEISVASP
ncbi:MAG TPA: hypothetical protein VF148_12170 [Acidimicrobiia bacterium]